MKEFRLNAQNDIIENIVELLKTSTTGIGFMKKYDYKIQTGVYSSTIVFTIKSCVEINPIDFFWIGYFSGKV